MADISQHIFRAYDIRGREGEELSLAFFVLLGRVYGTYLELSGVKSAVVGHDNRATSDGYAKSAIEGLVSAGMRVIDLGTVLTPMMYWAQHHFKTKGGLMITASHNPVGWNGAKLAKDLSETIGGVELQEIYKKMQAGDYKERAGGGVQQEDIKEIYINDLVSRVDIKKKFKIVVNTGNGTAGLFAPDFLHTIKQEITELNTEPDPTYPNYTPNPAETEMMADTSKKVLEVDADFGLAFDGDGDRVGLVDEKGNVIWPDRYMIFLARGVLKDIPGAKIIYDVKSSDALSEDIKAHGGMSIMAKTGHANIKAKLKETGAALAGEMSGHIFFKHGYYGFDDAPYAALKLIEFFAGQDKKVSELMLDIPQYVSSPSLNAEVPDDKKFEVVKKLTEEFKKDGYKVDETDGARVSFDFSTSSGRVRGWGLVRVSNTSPAITLRFEGKTEQNMQKIRQIFEQKLSQFPEITMPSEWKAA